MDPRSFASLLAAGRVAVGTAAFIAPRRFATGWIGRSAEAPGVDVVVRAFGVRDLALGVGTLAALGEPRRARAWLEAGMLSDAGDAAATLMARRQLPLAAALGVFGVAVGALGVGAWARMNLTDGADGS